MDNSNVVNKTNTTEVLETNVEETKTTQPTETETVITETKEEAVKEDVKTVEPTKVETKHEMTLTHLKKDFVYELMSIPTLSSHEYRMTTFIILWARKNGIKYEFDTYGNIYLTKGELDNGEFYPCVTAHLDSVQQKHKLYAQAGQPLDIKTRIINKKHEIYVDGMGIGGDDKAGVLIGLSMFSHVEKLKACFFLEEEIGCKGSNNMNVEWFRNVGYVIGYDSPDLNRAAYACSGVKLFSAAFFKEHMQDICKAHGLTDFRSEPYTDVKTIREKTNIICMNFGSGYYNCHSSNEYCIIEDMDTACRMGHALIDHLGRKRYELEHKPTTSAWGRRQDGTYGQLNKDEDEEFLRTLSSTYRATSGGYNRAAYGYGDYYDDEYADWEEYWNSGAAHQPTKPSTTPSSATKTSTSSSTIPPKKEESGEEMIPVSTLKYISEKYDERITAIEIELKKKCEEMNLNFDDFKSIFENKITF